MTQEELTELLPYTENFNLPLEQRIEIIKTVWGFTESFLDAAWGVHPIQLSCEQLEAGNLQSHNTDQISTNKKPTIH